MYYGRTILLTLCVHFLCVFFTHFSLFGNTFFTRIAVMFHFIFVYTSRQVQRCQFRFDNKSHRNLVGMSRRNDLATLGDIFKFRIKFICWIFFYCCKFYYWAIFSIKLNISSDGQNRLFFIIDYLGTK
uniref:Uncharacterized protein n=1 Tax=Cacopsylla melanoneura TaxID=428564 RepID=A0A8D8SST0_9HEMI